MEGLTGEFLFMLFDHEPNDLQHVSVDLSTRSMKCMEPLIQSKYRLVLRI